VSWANGKSFYINGSGGGRVPYPAGATYFTTTGTVTGAIKIKLPTASKGLSDMISFEVSIFDYSSNESVKLLINAYQYSTVNWTNHTVVILTGSSGKDYTVRFGSDSTSHCLWIAETSSTWSHPQVSVSNFTCGYSASAVNYVDGWAVTFVTAFDTVQDTVNTNLPIPQIANDSINSQHYAAGSIDNEHIADNAINSEHYADGSIDNAHIADNAINSEHYADGSIDRVHLAADVIDSTKLANDSVNSEHYVSNSIDALHLNVSGNGTTSQWLRSDGDGTMSWVTPPDTNTDTNTTYSADGNYGMTLSGTAFRLENDRRRNSTTTDVYSGNTHDYTFYDASHGIRWYTAGAEEMRLENDGDLHVDGSVTAYSSTVSDKRLKTDIVTLENAVDKIKQIRGVEFTRIKDGKRSAGVIAQELEVVLPQAITEKALPFEADTETMYKTVDYDQIHGLLIEAIKEQQTQIDDLKLKLEELT